MSQLTVSVQVVALQMLQHMFSSYEDIDEIYLKENTVKMMGPYDPVEPFSRLIVQPEKGQEFVRVVGQTIFDTMVELKGITLLAQTVTFNKDIWEWIRQSPKLNTWSIFQMFFHRYQGEHKR